MENDHILDSGEIYKKPSNDLPDLELKSKVEIDTKGIDSSNMPKEQDNDEYRLSVIDKDKLKYRASIGTYLLALVVFLFGLMFGGGILKVLLVDTVFRLEMIGNILMLVIAFLFALFLIVGGLSKVFLDTTPITFDRRRQLYWKSRLPSFLRPEKKKGSFNNIKAVQLLSSEINLVLENNNRFHLKGYSEGPVFEEATFLATFLGVPMLDAQDIEDIKVIYTDSVEQNKSGFINWYAMDNMAGWQTHQLSTKKEHLIKFTPTFGSYSFGMTFSSLAILMYYGILFHVLVYDGSFVHYLLLLVTILFGMPFLTLGLYSLFRHTIPTQFDKKTRRYKKGRFLSSGKNVGAFSAIKAVQFLDLNINLVLTNNERVWITNHHDNHGLEQAITLAEFIGVPLLKKNLTSNGPAKGYTENS